MNPGLLRVDPHTLTTRWLPLDADGLTVGGRRPLAEGDFSFRIKRNDESCKLIAGNRVLLDGVLYGAPALNGDEVISCLRPKMPVYLFLSGPPARQLELEAAISSRDRDEDWLVYADWLQQQGDPMGIALMRARSFRGCARPNFLMRRRVQVEWRYCFWTSAAILWETDDPVLELQLLMALLKFPQARLLRSLKVDLPAMFGDEQLAERLATQLLDYALPSSIEHLELGRVFPDVSWRQLRNRFPRWDGEPFNGVSRSLRHTA